MATTNIQQLILAILRYSGALGNSIFFICSAWFLLDNDKVDSKKILRIILDVWVISMAIFIPTYIIRSGSIPIKLVIQQIMPTTFENNWYITCYLLFYSLHAFLNLIIKKTEQRTLLKATLVMLCLYVGVNCFLPGKFFSSNLILWITIYFAIAYIKFYLFDLSNKIRLNILLFVIGCVGHISVICITNFIGLNFEMFRHSLLRWNSNCNPFLLLIAISLFNIARNVRFDSKGVNYVSGLSLFIYIIHENQLLRTLYRPQMWNFVYQHFGYDYILIWMVILVVLVFSFGLISSIVYKYTIGKIVAIVCNQSYPVLQRIYTKIEQYILKLH